MSTFLYLETNPVNLANLLTFIVLMFIMYFTCKKFNYITNIFIYCIVLTLFGPFFDKLMSSMVPWINLSPPINFWSFLVNFILGIIVVKILIKLSDYFDDAKLFILLGSVSQFIVELVLYLLIVLIF